MLLLNIHLKYIPQLIPWHCKYGLQISKNTRKGKKEMENFHNKVILEGVKILCILYNPYSGI